jgi:hypothetical protein
MAKDGQRKPDVSIEPPHSSTVWRHLRYSGTLLGLSQDL